MKYVIKSYNNDKFFVKGHGFVAASPAEATQLCSDQAASTQKCLEESGLGISHLVEVPEHKSFAPVYIRQKDVNADGSTKANRRNPSPRRFATRDEAVHHASRFMKIEGHVGFRILETTDAVNSAVNLATGKTNPEIGKRRVNR